MPTDERAIQSKSISSLRLSGWVGVAVLLALVLLLPGRAFATTVTWDGGCGADTDWSCAANWIGNVPPGPEDSAVFDSRTSGKSTVDPAFSGTVSAIKLNPKYAGTVLLARSLSVRKAFSQRGGAFMAGGQPLSLKALSVSGGTFVASSGVTSVSSALKIAGAASFDANGGMIDLVGAGASLSCNGVAFANVVFSNTSGTKTVGSDCNLPLGGDPRGSRGGSVRVNGVLSGAGTLTVPGALTLGASGELRGFSGLTTRALAINGSYDFGAYAPFTVEKAFALESEGRFAAPVDTATFSGNFTIEPGADFEANGGTVVFAGSKNGKLACAKQRFDLVRFANTAGRKTVGADCSLPLGDSPTLGEGAAASVAVNGELSGSGVLSAQQALLLGGTAKLSGFHGLVSQGALVLRGANEDFGSFKLLDVGSYSQTGGAVTASAGTDINGKFVLNEGASFGIPGDLSVAGSFIVGPEATFDSGGTVVFDGASSAFLSCGPATFSLVTFSHVYGTKTVGPGCTLPLGRSPRLNSGGSITLDGVLLGSGTLTTSGTLTLGKTGGLDGFTGLIADDLVIEGAYDFSAYNPFSVRGLLTVRPGGAFTPPRSWGELETILTLIR